MAQISKPAIPAKMYRHFAVVTVVLTAALAMLASGGEREQGGGIEAPLIGSSPTPSPTPRGSATPAYGEARLVNRTSTGSFGREAGPGSGYGEGSGGGGGGSYGFINSSALPLAGSENAGFTAQYLNSLSEEELEALLRSMQEAGITTDEQLRQASMLVEAASRRRSGVRVNSVD